MTPAAGELGWPNWVGVVADDLEKQRGFYRDVLGLRELASGEGWIQFDFGFPNVLELVARSVEPEYDRRRYQVGFSVDDIHAARESLVERGVEAITDVLGGPAAQAYWCYFRDAEGNVFELSQRLGGGWD